MKTSVEIAREATLRPIAEIAGELGILGEELEFYGRYKAKIGLQTMGRLKDRKNGELILVSAITPTSAGEGKTTTAIGLAQAFHRVGRRAIACIRQPSLGPTFGLKGGGAGGGYSQVLPMEEINLHFTGDIHAVTTAHNLLAAMLDNHIYWGNGLKIDPQRILLPRVMDMNDRLLRRITVGVGGDRSPSREAGFEITAASEVMAILGLCRSLSELKERLGRMMVAHSSDGRPVKASDLKAHGAMAVILKDALKPNLVQTLGGTPAIVHGGPFGNVAHGSPSLVGIETALKLSDYVLVEAGFGVDLGAEKFFDIVCPTAGLRPSLVVVVATIRALKQHGGLPAEKAREEDVNALRRGFSNLEKHLETVAGFGVPAVVAINRHEADTPHEIETLREICREKGVEAVLSEVYSKGGEGGIEAVEAILKTLGATEAKFRPLYDWRQPVKEKIESIAEVIYGADGVAYTERAEERISEIEDLGFSGLPICIAKTPFSLSDSKELLGRPRGFKITIRDLRISAGAGFIVAYAGDILTMPGLPSHPAAERMDVDDEYRISGLF